MVLRSLNENKALPEQPRPRGASRRVSAKPPLKAAAATAGPNAATVAAAARAAVDGPDALVARAIENNISLGCALCVRTQRRLRRSMCARRCLSYSLSVCGWASRVESHGAVHRRVAFLALEPGVHVLPTLTVEADPEKLGGGHMAVVLPRPLRVVVLSAAHAAASTAVAPTTAPSAPPDATLAW
jgi:hypothetical protein